MQIITEIPKEPMHYCRDCCLHVPARYFDNHREVFPSHDIEDETNDWFDILNEEDE